MQDILNVCGTLEHEGASGRKGKWRNGGEETKCVKTVTIGFYSHSSRKKMKPWTAERMDGQQKKKEGEAVGRS